LPGARCAQTVSRQRHRPLDQATVEVGGDQALAEADQRAFAERWGDAVEAVEHQLPAAIHRCRLDHLVVRGAGVRLEHQGQRELRRGNGWLAQPTRAIGCGKLCLQGVIDKQMPLLAQQHEQLRAADAGDDRCFLR